jgi:hypothetical protein
MTVLSFAFMQMALVASAVVCGVALWWGRSSSSAARA